MLKIKRNSVLTNKDVSPYELLSIPVVLILNKDGSIYYLKVLKGSGIPEVDYFMTKLIEEASSSFPPVPTSLREDKDIHTIRVVYSIYAGQIIARKNPDITMQRRMFR